MNMKKLLATTAIAAMAATSANAIDLQFNATAPGGNAAGVFDITANVTSVATGTLANEVDLSGLGQNAILGLQLTTATALPAGDNVRLTVNLPAGVTFSQALTGLLDPDPAALTAGGIVPNNFASVYTNITVSTGGSKGSSTVQFLIQAGASTAGFNLALPVTLNSAACTSGAPVTMNLTTEQGTPIEGGSVTLNDGGTPAKNLNTITCINGLRSADFTGGPGDLGVTADTGAEDSLLALPNFVTFVKDQDGSGPLDAVATQGADTTTQASLGTINAEFGAGALDAIGGNDLAAGDIGALTFSVTFDTDVTGIKSVAILDGSTTANLGDLISNLPAVTTPTGLSYVFSTTNATAIAELTDSTPDPVLVTLTGGASPAVITSQGVSVTASTATFKDSVGVNLIGSEPFASGALENIQKDGRVFGPFDWVGDATKSSRNIFRSTGAAAAATAGEVIFSNSSNGKNGVFPFTLNSVNGEAQTFSNTDLDTLNPGFGRADVTFNFFATTPTDMDRLLLRGDILSNFGNNAGSLGANKGDD